MNDKKVITLSIVALLLTIPSLIFSGYVLSVLWGWFMVPIFGMPALSIPAAIGVWMVIGFITHQTIDADDSRTSEKKLYESIGQAISRPLLALLVGYIVHLYM